jgi:hypothetical protein
MLRFWMITCEQQYFLNFGTNDFQLGNVVSLFISWMTFLSTWKFEPCNEFRDYYFFWYTCENIV